MTCGVGVSPGRLGEEGAWDWGHGVVVLVVVVGYGIVCAMVCWVAGST